MSEISRLVASAAIQHAEAEFPREACGLVIVQRGREVYVPCRNAATAPGEQFVLPAEDFVAASERGEVVAVVHSHPNASAEPSEADLVACEASGLPWHIVGIPSGVWRSIKPSGYRAPLVGRQFHHGILDCYTLMRDAYSEFLNITLPDYRREDNWWNNGGNLYLDHFENVGFVQVPAESLREYDGLLMQVASPVPNHAAMYLGDNVILHHVAGRLSSRDVYGGYWMKHTTHVLRHKSRL